MARAHSIPDRHADVAAAAVGVATLLSPLLPPGLSLALEWAGAGVAAALAARALSAELPPGQSLRQALRHRLGGQRPFGGDAARTLLRVACGLDRPTTALGRVLRAAVPVGAAAVGARCARPLFARAVPALCWPPQLAQAGLRARLARELVESLAAPSRPALRLVPRPAQALALAPASTWISVSRAA